jgi:hypothetical protein
LLGILAREGIWSFIESRMGETPHSSGEAVGLCFSPMKTIKRLDNGETARVKSQTWPEELNRTPSETSASRETVALQAYYIYVEQGFPHGRDVQHWLEAEARVLST